MHCTKEHFSLSPSLSLSLSQVPLTARKASKAQRDVDPNEAPRRVALVNAKYVTYGRITRDLAVVLFTSSSSLIRRYYLIKMVQFYVEKLGETLCQLGIDTDKFGIRYQGKIATRSKNHQRKRNPPPTLCNQKMQ